MLQRYHDGVTPEGVKLPHKKLRHERLRREKYENQRRTYVMDTLPCDVLRLIATWPECQLRNTCTRFLGEIPPISFASLKQFESSQWFRRHCELSALGSILEFKNTVTGEPVTYNKVHALQPPYIFNGRRITPGLLIWDESIIPHLCGIPGHSVFKLTRRISAPALIREFDHVNERYGCGYTHMLAFWDIPVYDHPALECIYVNYVDEITIKYLKCTHNAALIYECNDTVV